MTREQWLNEAVKELREHLFKPQGEVVPEVRVSVGFPGGGSARKRIGEYWHAEAIQDKVPQVFISPVLESPVKALDVLVHELVHAVVPKAKHGKEFKRVAYSVGLTGKATATVAGPELEEKLKTLSEKLGAFPHSAINLADRKKQATNLKKVECIDCGYVVRVTNKWIESVGTPICPCNHTKMEVA